MWDTDGRRYIDGSSGAMVCNIGHSNPAVLEAMRAQMARSTFGYRLHFETDAAEALAARTASLAPEGLDRVFFVSGGSEAVESAIKLARQYALAKGEGSRWKVISRFPSYHGCTLGALALTGYDPLTEPFAPMMRSMPLIPAPTAWADHRDPDDPATGRHYAGLLEDAIQSEGPDSVLAFIVEPVGWRLHRRAGPARRLHGGGGRDLRAPRHPDDPRRGDDRRRPHRAVLRRHALATACPTSS